MSEENKNEMPKAPVDMNPVTIEANANAAHIDEIAEEGSLGGEVASALESEYEKQDILYSKDDSIKDAKEAALDEMEKASQKALDAMREAGEDSEKIVNEAEEKLDDAFAEFRTYIKSSTNPERVKAEMDRFGNEVAKLLKGTKESVDKVVSSEQFKSTVNSGKDFVTGTGTMIGEGLKYGYDKAMEVPELKKVAEGVNQGVDKLRQSEVLKDVTNNVEKGINDFNNFIFNGLHSFFDASKKSDDDDKAE